MTARKSVGNTLSKTKKEHEKILQDIQIAIDTAYKAGGNALAKYCNLGITLITARNTLKKALFLDLVDGEILPTKQINRYIGLCIHKDSKKEYSNGSDKKLKIDERIEEQLKKEEPFGDMINPNMQKLQKCKTMPTDDWNAVLSGNDAPYDAKKGKREVTPPKGMTIDDFEVYKKKGTKTLCGELFAAEKEIETLTEKITTIEKDNEKISTKLAGFESGIVQRDGQINSLNEQIASLKKQIKDLNVESEVREGVAA